MEDGVGVSEGGKRRKDWNEQRGEKLLIWTGVT
jgi:hypothetical protein